MKRLLITTLTILALVACSKESQTSTPAASQETAYPMTATIVSRDPAKNTVNLDNVEVPGKMAAMKMDYELRAAKVAELPPDGSAVEVTVHDTNGSYYVTDVKPKK
jgi:Cu/Ag efflux protein CusF